MLFSETASPARPSPGLFRSVRGRLVLLVVALAVPALLLAGLMIGETYRGERAAAAHNLLGTARALAGRTLPQTIDLLRDLMTRMGHDSPRAALIYQHASREADRAIAKAVDVAVRQAQKPAPRNRRRANRNGSSDVPPANA